MCTQVAVGSLRVSQRGADAHENANRVSVHAEAVQRESNAHGQRSSLHLILLLQRASKTLCRFFDQMKIKHTYRRSLGRYILKTLHFHPELLLLSSHVFSFGLFVLVIPIICLFHLCLDASFSHFIVTVVLCCILIDSGVMSLSLMFLCSVLSNQKPPLSAPRRWSVQTIHDCPVLTSAPPCL